MKFIKKFINSRKGLFTLYFALIGWLTKTVYSEITKDKSIAEVIKDPKSYLVKFLDYRFFADVSMSSVLYDGVLLMIFIWIGLEFYKGFKSLKLLYRYYVLSENSFPGLAAAKKVIRCLWLGNYQFNWLAARLSIECQIWANDDKNINEDNVINTYINAIRNQPKGDIGNLLDPVLNCFVLTDSTKRSLIENYFEAIQKINKDDNFKDRFLTNATIKTGYLAPQHLLDGLLSNCNESWPLLIESYESRVAGGIDDNDRTQLFTFYCWLLWGPSIPIGQCQQWWIPGAQGNVALQYGFGDENNSLPIFPLINPDNDDKNFRDLTNYICHSPFAQPIPNLKVSPVWISQNVNDRTVDLKKSLGFLGPAQLSISRNPVLKQNDEPKGKLALDYIAAPNFNNTVQPVSPNRYYSSYIWVMFIICDGSVIPKYKSDNNPWFGMLPYFEHGNIADDSTYSVFKRQLANKALASISRLNKTNNTKYIYRYACASDDSNCSDDSCMYSYSSNYKSSIKIRDYIGNLLGNSIEWKHLEEGEFASKEYGRFADLKSDVSMPTNSDNWPYKRQFSACHLPEIINSFYENISQKRS